LKSGGLDDSLIDDPAGLAYGLETDLVMVEFEVHVMVIIVEAGSADLAAEIHSSTPGFSACSSDEVLDTLLRLDSFIDVIVSRKPGLNAVFGEQRFEALPKA